MNKPAPRESLTARDLNVLWHPCSQIRDYRDFPPLEVVGAQGGWLQLADGRKIYDAISSWWCKSLGHGHPRLRRALIAQAERFEHVILANTTNEGVVRFCENILAAANRGAKHFSKVFFADNGSTGVEVALKMSLQAQRQLGRTARTKFAALANGYHGETVGALSVGDCGLYKDTYRDLLFDCKMIPNVPYRSGPGDPRWNECEDEWKVIETRLNGIQSTLAAIIYEPILQGAGGMRVYSPEFLRCLRAWADANDVLLIADEIAAGMGRCGMMLAGHLSGVHPDLCVLGKGLTAGFLPLSVVLTTDAIYGAFDADYGEKKAFLHSNTFAGNALAVAVANEVLSIYGDEKILEQVARNGAVLRDGMAKLACGNPSYHDVRGIGMVAAIDLRDHAGYPLDPDQRTGYRVYKEAVRRGALLRPLGDTMYVLPPLNATPADIDFVLTVLGDAVSTVLD